MKLSEIAKQIHETSKSSGWWEHMPPAKSPTPVERLALIACEVSEAIEEERVQSLGPDTLRETVDIIIRAIDFAVGYYSVEELEEALYEKMAHNKTRPWRHGGKLL